jgi:hypothetical protein
MTSSRMRTMPVVLGAQGDTPLIKPWPMGFEKSESWLQKLVHDNPQLLPIDQIEQALGPLVPVAMEVACSHGFIDNLFLTPDGNIVLLEVKLWKNPEMRREVVAQVLDYVASLSTMGWEAFETAILKARGDASLGLYSLIPENMSPLPEADFVDAVSRNLKRGRIVAVIVGDGIREETERLVDLVQSHSGTHFTLALVAISFFINMTTKDLIAIPDVLMKTIMIERGIVIIDEGVPIIKPMPIEAGITVKTISTELFDEALAKVATTLPLKISQFVVSLHDLGVYSEQKKSLQLLAKAPGLGLPIKLGYIDRYGKLWTDNVIPSAPPVAARQYVSKLAALVNGSVSNKDIYSMATTNGKSAPFVSDILDAHQSQWRRVIDDFITSSIAEGSIDREDGQ